jgi:hypothetical protein
MPSTLMFYRFTRRMILKNELGPFMHVYDPARLEPWKFLPDLFGRMVFSFDGFEDNWQIDRTCAGSGTCSTNAGRIGSGSATSVNEICGS